MIAIFYKRSRRDGINNYHFVSTLAAIIDQKEF